MVELPVITKPMTEPELYEATCKELAFFMEENRRHMDALTAARKEIERLQAEFDELAEKFLATETVEELREQVRRTGGPV